MCDRFRYKDRAAWLGQLRDGRVEIDGERAEAGRVLRAGAQVAWRRDQPEPWVRTDVTVLFEDDAIVVVDKPPHLPVHADGAFVHHTLVGLLKADRPSVRVVHRLDRETSGVVVLARTRAAARDLTDQFRHHTSGDARLHKSYVAVVHGLLGAPGDSGRFDNPISRDPSSEISLRRRALPLAADAPEDAEPAHTDYEVLEHLRPAAGPRSIVRLVPRTGRTHQLRVHLEGFGYPVIGDKLYGRPDAGYLAFVHHVKAGGRPDDPSVAPWPGRCLLHAERLRFEHPTDGRSVEFEAAWPDDLIAARG